MSNCTIYNKTFLEDLTDKKGSIHRSTIDFNLLSSLISASPQPNNLWQPVFITKNDSQITDRLLLDKGYASGYNNHNNVLGVQNFLTINSPQFNFWETTGSMVTDWTLNRQNISHFPVHGLMFWFKKIVNNSLPSPITSFPNNCRIKLVNSTRSFVKIDNQTLYETNNQNKNSSKFNSDGTISFNYGDSSNNYVSLASLGNNPLFVESDIVVSENRYGFTTSATNTSYSDITIGSNKYLLWIPNGDVYSYYINYDEFITQGFSLCPRAYCSPSLYQTYNNIYHKLTFEQKRTDGGRSTHIARSYKNLAKYLSTSPFIDEFSISKLCSDTVLSLTNNFLVTDGGVSATSIYLRSISSYLDSFETSDNHKNTSNNVIYNFNTLKEKIVEKYGSKLVIDGYGYVESKNSLEDGANVRVDQFGEYTVGASTQGGILYANQSINVGSIAVETDYGQKKSRLRLRFINNPQPDPGTIPRTDLILWDAAKPIIKFDPTVNTINLVLAKSTNNPNLGEYRNVANDDNPNTVVFKYVDTALLPSQIQLKILPDTLNIESYRTAEDARNPSEILVKKDFVCTWEKVSGPSLVFINENILSLSPTGGDQLKYNFENNTVTDTYGEVVGFETLTGPTEVYVVPSRTGRYQIKCTISSPYGMFVKIKTFYVVSGSSRVKRSGERDIPMGVMIDNDVNITEKFLGAMGTLLSTVNTPRGDVEYPKLITPDENDVNYVKNREKHPIILNSNNLRVHAPILNSVAIHGRGLALPIGTTSETKIFRRRPEKLINNTLYYLEDSYNGPIVEGGILDPSYVYDAPSKITMIYSCPQLKYKLTRISLEHIRHRSNPEHGHCFNLYSTELYGSASRWGRGKGSTMDGWENDVYHYRSWASAITKESYETFSTDFAPPIKTYGGWDADTINKIGISIPNHPGVGQIFPPITGRPISYPSDTPSSDPPYIPPGFGMKYCFEDILPENTSKYLSFNKGVFYPGSGWIPSDSPLYNDVKNLSSVLKFNPGARESYSFNGPSINKIQNDSYVQKENTTFIIPRKFNSSIDIGIAEGAQWIQESQQCGGNTAPCRADSPPHWIWLNQIHREYGDQEVSVAPGKGYNHGYRILSGGATKKPERRSFNNDPARMDEFTFVSNYRTNSFSYKFPVSGPRYPPGPIPPDVINYLKKARVAQPNCIKPNGEQPENYFIGLPNPKTTWKGLRNPRVLNFSIKDIEVKLNFLNYVNTKDISIALEVTPCTDETYRIDNPAATKPPKYNPPIITSSMFVDQTIQANYDAIAPGKVVKDEWIINPININNYDIANYLDSLSRTNTRFHPNKINKFSTAPLGLYLINQEYIQNHSYNLSLKFSDHANKYNVLNDHNYNTSNSYSALPYQNIVQTNDPIRPSIAPFGYSDKDVNIYHNIVVANKLNLTNNTFSKYGGKPMFDYTIRCPPNAGPGSKTSKTPNKNDVTIFNCIITLYDEHDDMFPNDNTANSQLYTNIYDYSKSINSTNLFGSLCSWELLLHFGDTIKPTSPNLVSLHSYGNNEPLSLIDYGKPPQYGGYSFIANLKEYKHMLPFVNINAPNVFFQDYSLCESSDPEDFGKLKAIPGAEFPWLAILAATYAYTGIIGLAGAGGLGGVMIGMAAGSAAMEAAVAQIVNYYNAVRAQEFKEAVANDIYHQDYARYAFGSPEKILINFSKDDIFWYKAEASIFKYINTPILEYKKYSYIRLNKNSFPSLSRFTFDIITDINDVIDEQYVKPLALDCETFSSISSPVRIGETLYNAHDLINISFTNNEDNDCTNGLYYVPTGGAWISVSGNPSILCSKPDYISRNQVLFNDDSITEYSIFKNFYDDIAKKKLIMIEGSIPYEIFSLNESIQVSGTDIAPDPVQITYESIDFTTSEGMARYQESIDPITGEFRPIVSQNQEPAEVTYTTKILGKALIYKDNKTYSVLKVDRLDMDKVDFISPDNNVIVLFDLSTSTDINGNLINMYGFEKESIKNSIPEVFNTTNSYGSYGDGSAQIKKNILKNIPRYNNIEKIYDMFNNHKSDRILFNKMFFTTNADEKINNTKYIGSSIAYTHKLNEISTIINNDSKYIIQENIDPKIVESIEGILNDFRNFQYNNIESKNIHLLYVKNNNFKSQQFISSDYGYASVENDYEEYCPIEAVDATRTNIDTQTFQDLVDRLAILENTIDNVSLANIVGNNNTNDTNIIVSSRHIPYIYQHYETLPAGTTSKKLSEYALSVFYKERNDILKLLNEISDYQIATITITGVSTTITGRIITETSSSIAILQDDVHTKISKENIVKITRTFSRKTNKIRPQKLAIVSTFKAFDTLPISAYAVNYENNNDDYWINLDPHQSCSIAEELRPKVLKKITYICRPANYVQGIKGGPLLSINNICKRVQGSILEGQNDPDGINFSKGSSKEFGSGPYETYIYTIGENTVNNNKTQIENKAKGAGLPIKWEEISIKRNYHINGKSDLWDTVYNYSEIMVTAIETYDILLSPLEINNGKSTSSPNTQDADVFALGDNPNMSVGEPEDFVRPEDDGNFISSLPPKNAGVSSGGSIPASSPDGFGLLTTLTNIRAGESMKIYNICNLDDVNNLKVKIRKIPRQLRGVDAYSTVYRYGPSGFFRPGRRTSSGGRDPLDPFEIREAGSFGGNNFQPVVNNNMYYWKCMEIQGNKLVPSTTPLFFQLMNEMMFRTYYGSVDRLENQGFLLRSRFLWEMIPYQFLNKIPGLPPEAPPTDQGNPIF